LRCLEKSRESRFQSARDLAFALESWAGTLSGTTRAEAAFRGPWLRQPMLAWALASALALALLLVLMLWRPWRGAAPASPIVLSAQPGTDVSIADSISTAFGQTMTISANGDIIAFQHRKSGAVAASFTCCGSIEEANRPPFGLFRHVRVAHRRREILVRGQLFERVRRRASTDANKTCASTCGETTTAGHRCGHRNTRERVILERGAEARVPTGA